MNTKNHIVKTSPPQASCNEHPFHKFAQDLYQKEPANQALIHFYKKFSLSTDLLLFLIWYATAQCGRARKPYLQALHDNVFVWHHHIILPLKNLLDVIQQHHHGAKNAQLKKMIEQEVIESMQIAQSLCYSTPIYKRSIRRSPSQQIQDACYNLMQLFCHFNIQPDETDHHYNLQLLCVVFATQSNEMIHNCYSQALHALNFSPQQKMLQLRFGEI